MGRVAFELVVQDAYGLAVAARHPVDRVELCSALAVGGVTPSAGLIAAAVATPGIPPVHVLVRPRPGGFEYSHSEADLIERDVRHALSAGAAGVVIGGVRSGRIDTSLVKRVVATAGHASVTFHRAFDTLPDPAAALAELADLGVRRILTAGGPTTVEDGLPALTGLVAAAAGRVEIMAGGGVRPSMVPALAATGVAAIHASAKGAIPDPTGVHLGAAAPHTARDRETTDETEVGHLLAALRAAAR